jgi:hypothetical protein
MADHGRVNRGGRSGMEASIAGRCDLAGKVRALIRGAFELIALRGLAGLGTSVAHGHHRAVVSAASAATGRQAGLGITRKERQQRWKGQKRDHYGCSPVTQNAPEKPFSTFEFPASSDRRRESMSQLSRLDALARAGIAFERSFDRIHPKLYKVRAPASR